LPEDGGGETLSTPDTARSLSTAGTAHDGIGPLALLAGGDSGSMEGSTFRSRTDTARSNPGAASARSGTPSLGEPVTLTSASESHAATATAAAIGSEPAPVQLVRREANTFNAACAAVLRSRLGVVQRIRTLDLSPALADAASALQQGTVPTPWLEQLSLPSGVSIDEFAATIALRREHLSAWMHGAAVLWLPALAYPQSTLCCVVVDCDGVLITRQVLLRRCESGTQRRLPTDVGSADAGLGGSTWNYQSPSLRCLYPLCVYRNGQPFLLFQFCFCFCFSLMPHRCQRAWQHEVHFVRRRQRADTDRVWGWES
jgi:hypothetical protein